MRMDGSLGTVTSSLRATKQESSERNGERKKGWGWETERKTETESRMFKVNALTFFFFFICATNRFQFLCQQVGFKQVKYN